MLDDVVYLDLETTGGSAVYDRIIEIGLIEVRGGEIVGEWSTLVNPRRHIPHGIQTLTGITDAMVADAPGFEEVSAALVRRLEGRLLAAHNARFDYGFLRHEFARAGVRYRAPVLCTVKLSRKLYPQHRLHNLDALLVRHALFLIDRHRALGDARVLVELAALWRRELGEAAVKNACLELLRPPVVPAHLPADILDDVPEARGVYVLHAADGEALYVGRAANLRSRVVAHFAGSAGRDAELCARVARIEWRETHGELGTSLAEAELVRTLRPAYNRRNGSGETWTWHWDPVAAEPALELVEASAVELRERDHFYGLFRSRASARQALRGLAEAHGLCLAKLGVEAAGDGGACAAHACGRCRGTCVGAESALSHAMRVTQALANLRVRRWPYPGAIAIRERTPYGETGDMYVLDEWRYLGTARTPSEIHELAATRGPAAVDATMYRIISNFLKSPPARCELVHVPRACADRASPTLS